MDKDRKRERERERESVCTCEVNVCKSEIWGIYLQSEKRPMLMTLKKGARPFDGNAKK